MNNSDLKKSVFPFHVSITARVLPLTGLLISYWFLGIVLESFKTHLILLVQIYLPGEAS